MAEQTIVAVVTIYDTKQGGKAPKLEWGSSDMRRVERAEVLREDVLLPLFVLVPAFGEPDRHNRGDNRWSVPSSALRPIPEDERG